MAKVTVDELLEKVEVLTSRAEAAESKVKALEKAQADLAEATVAAVAGNVSIASVKTVLSPEGKAGCPVCHTVLVVGLSKG